MLPDVYMGRLSRRCMIPASEISVRTCLQSVIGEARRAGIDADTRDRLQLVLAEVLNNIVEHGGHGEAGGIIDLKLDGGPSGIEIVVRDDGRPLPRACLENRSSVAESWADEPPEGGFGWPLILMLADEVKHQRDGNWNSLKVRVR